MDTIYHATLIFSPYILCIRPEKYAVIGMGKVSINVLRSAVFEQMDYNMNGFLLQMLRTKEKPCYLIKWGTYLTQIS